MSRVCLGHQPVQHSQPDQEHVALAGRQLRTCWMLGEGGRQVKHHSSGHQLYNQKGISN